MDDALEALTSLLLLNIICMHWDISWQKNASVIYISLNDHDSPDVEVALVGDKLSSCLFTGPELIFVFTGPSTGLKISQFELICGIKALGEPCRLIHLESSFSYYFKGTVQQDLRGVKSNINW